LFLLLALLALPLLACSSEPVVRADTAEIAMHVRGVGIDPVSDSPVVVLEEDDGERALPIWIGVAEARSIAREMEEIVAPRPNTHDLTKRLLMGLEADVERVVVTELLEGTYYALLVVRDGRRRIEIDARPSDAIAIALRVQAPVFVREALLTEATATFESSADPSGVSL
jgi:bifunctional DNase/RNase